MAAFRQLFSLADAGSAEGEPKDGSLLAAFTQVRWVQGGEQKQICENCCTFEMDVSRVQLG